MPCGFSTATEPRAHSSCTRPPASRDAGANPFAFLFAVGTGENCGEPPPDAAPVAATATAPTAIAGRSQRARLLIVPIPPSIGYGRHPRDAPPGHGDRPGDFHVTGRLPPWRHTPGMDPLAYADELLRR